MAEEYRDWADLEARVAALEKAERLRAPMTAMPIPPVPADDLAERTLNFLMKTKLCTERTPSSADSVAASTPQLPCLWTKSRAVMRVLKRTVQARKETAMGKPCPEPRIGDTYRVHWISEDRPLFAARYLGKVGAVVELHVQATARRQNRTEVRLKFADAPPDWFGLDELEIVRRNRQSKASGGADDE